MFGSKNIMRRQRSDLSENLFICSTPEGESYFERKKESLSEKFARGELDIEVGSAQRVDSADEERGEEQQNGSTTRQTNSVTNYYFYF